MTGAVPPLIGRRPPGLRVRPAEDRDAGAMADLLNLIVKRIEPDLPGAMSAEIVRRDVLSPDTPLGALVAELDGEVAGVALHLFAYEAAYAARGRYLQDLAVAPALRRRGVATALIAALARLTRAEGGEFVWWINVEAMPEGRALYRRLCDFEEPLVSFAITRETFARLADAG